MLKVLKNLSNEDPATAEYVEDQYMKDAAKEAGVTVKKLNAAMDRVYSDGYFGPISKQEWIEQYGRGDTADIKVALKIVEDAMSYVPSDIEYFDPRFEWEEDEDGNALPNAIIPGEFIRDEVFSFYYDIYGHR